MEMSCRAVATAVKGKIIAEGPKIDGFAALLLIPGSISGDFLHLSR